MRLCTVDVSCCIAFPTSCSRACLEWGWMINVYKSQFSLQWKIPPRTHAPTVLENPSQLLLLLVLSESCVRFSLKTFQAKKPPSLALWPHVLLLLLDCERRRRRRREECSYSSHSHLVCLLSSLCCVAHKEPLFPFAVFCRELSGTFFAVFKTGDVFMSLIWVPLTKVTSSHVGTVCWLRVTDRQISLGVWCYLHVIRAGNEHQLVMSIKTWLWLENFIYF